MAIVEVTVVPLGTQTPSLSMYVAGTHKLLKSQDKVNYQLTPMGTILEGDLDECLSLIRKMHEVPFEADTARVSTQIRIDDRRDKESSMDKKINSVNEKL
ncbi:MTH1187 family thiamine-binding protein [Proteinivorax hydrogeniformans]|uniref:MTH1187 family thiamine-binding protein n=1 Tax=Proteinivorax hydrogeniformans TaxID=1826727 RepID=A0AAU8HW78_9FIRM